ncbi:MAG: pyridoxal-phosphate dependent enzyme [Alphaproteobacteria bacterium]|nr:pyridoxal-phosphate dependent enzyme [Alphaproteobacteria bacterium]
MATCSSCGPWGVLEVEQTLRLPEDTGDGMERFLPLLPIDPSWPRPNLRVGNTPLVAARRLAAALGLRGLWLKDEGRNPSGSIRDRASWLAGAHSRMRTVATSSSRGDSGASSAVCCASMGSLAVLFVPRETSRARLAQMLVHGARVLRVQGGPTDAQHLCDQAIRELRWYNCNTGTNPMLVEGLKTCGIEIAEVQAVDWLSVPVSDGAVIAGIWKGLKEAYRLRLIDRLPRLLGVQTHRDTTVYEEWRNDGDSGPARAPRVDPQRSEGGVPRDWRRAVRAIAESGGRMVLVSDDDILTAMTLTARLGGVYPDKHAASAVAGLSKLRPGGTAIALITGGGWRDADSAVAAGAQPIDVPNRIESVLEAMELSNWGI